MYRILNWSGRFCPTGLHRISHQKGMSYRQTSPRKIGIDIIHWHIHWKYCSKMKVTVEWDPVKAQTNLIKHGVGFEEASTVFNDQMFITFLDVEHSNNEERYITMGLFQNNRLILIAHTDREGSIRVVSDILKKTLEKCVRILLPVDSITTKEMKKYNVTTCADTPTVLLQLCMSSYRDIR